MSPEPLLTPEEVSSSREVISRLLDGLGQAILGQEVLLKLAVTCILARGHLLLALPLILPLIETAGMNPIWFGIIVVKLLEIGLVTPPIGLNVYMIKSALGNLVTLPEVFRGVGWFIAMDFLTLLLLILIPALSLWLPQLAFG